ncbi:MAG: RNB domain-containing ribonuclease, partial [Firmicutes bacterium]|nr:RNB domain-containing ribonuclease [Bacillota bacterium]
YHLKGISKIHPKALQQLLDKIKGKKEERIISTVMLRSLMKAKYSHENLGHFGLAAKHYCHFTSPIRRYPDLVIHRILKEIISRDIGPEREAFLKDFVQKAAKQSSDQEIAAQEAERETEDLKKAEFMQDRIGEIFEGVISGVTSFGMFVELENTIEGLVKISNLEDDYYIFDDRNYSLIGETSKKVYKIGDEVEVKLVKADVASRQIDFILVEGQENGDEDAGGESGEFVPASYTKKKKFFKTGGKDKMKPSKKRKKKDKKAKIKN